MYHWNSKFQENCVGTLGNNMYPMELIFPNCVKKSMHVLTFFDNRSIFYRRSKMQIMTDGSLPVSLNNSLRIHCVGRALQSIMFVLLFCICHCSKSIILRDRHQLVTMIIKQFTSHIRISAFSIMRFPLASRLNCMNG